MDSDTSLDIANLKAIIELRQEEERRLRSIVSDARTASQVRIQAQTKWTDTLRDMQCDMEELASLKANN